MRLPRFLLPAVILAFIALQAQAVETAAVRTEAGSAGMHLQRYLLAQAPAVQPETAPRSPAPGTLVLPEDPAARDDTDKKCMTVCASWGEECTYINRGPAGTTRSCRRTCQQYTEECF